MIFKRTKNQCCIKDILGNPLINENFIGDANNRFY